MKKMMVIACGVLFSCAVWGASYGSVDARARQAPPAAADTLENTARYLIEPYQDDEKKARVLLAWIVYHMDYDQYKFKEGVKSAKSVLTRKRVADTGDPFVTRVGTCADIARLYQRLIEAAGMEGEVVTGYAGERVTAQNKEEFRHAWNVVKIKGKWELIDPTWAMGQARVFQSVASQIGHKRAIQKRERNAYQTTKTRRNRSVDDKWFMTKPHEMIQTHYPDEKRWQLMPTPRSRGSFLK